MFDYFDRHPNQGVRFSCLIIITVPLFVIDGRIHAQSNTINVSIDASVAASVWIGEDASYSDAVPLTRGFSIGEEYLIRITSTGYIPWQQVVRIEKDMPPIFAELERSPDWIPIFDFQTTSSSPSRLLTPLRWENDPLVFGVTFNLRTFVGAAIDQWYHYHPVDEVLLASAVSPFVEMRLPVETLEALDVARTEAGDFESVYLSPSGRYVVYPHRTGELSVPGEMGSDFTYWLADLEMMYSLI